MKILIVIIVLIVGGGYYFYQNTVKPTIDENEYIQLALEALESADFSEAEELLSQAYELSKEIPFDELYAMYEDGSAEEQLTDALSALEDVKDSMDEEKIQEAIDLVESLKEKVDDSSLLEDISEESIQEALELME
ncbi:hypothetical protein [Tannockella kyphosi]|uniref:hypothetical protein n=1 Tax=Tannockella kyphosi TaxID=2899121 RepID=UPI0020111B2B|nr:hypothetical protein [Tannockella kyphosi]